MFNNVYKANYIFSMQYIFSIAYLVCNNLNVKHDWKWTFLINLSGYFTTSS